MNTIKTSPIDKCYNGSTIKHKNITQTILTYKSSIYAHDIFPPSIDRKDRWKKPKEFHLIHEILKYTLSLTKSY
jgi:hypothetical protein